MNVVQFAIENEGLLGALAVIIGMSLGLSVLGWLSTNITEEKRRNQYRVVVDRNDPSRFGLQNRWKTIVGWSKWKSGYTTYGTVEQATSDAVRKAEERVAKFSSPKVVVDLGTLPEVP